MEFVLLIILIYYVKCAYTGAAIHIPIWFLTLMLYDDDNNMHHILINEH